MATYDIRPLQLKILETLLSLQKCCEEHGLRYYIMAGTMLGAVRHKGFIPWDDDLDIGMPRPDYEKLIANCAEWLPFPLEMVCHENNPDYPLPFAKIQNANTTLIERAHLKFLGGIYIDVFPLDGMTSCKLRQRLHFMRYEIFKRLLYFVYRDPYKHGKGFNYLITKSIQCMFTKDGIHKRLKRYMTKYNYDTSKMVVDHDDGLKGVMAKEIIGTPTPILFEGKEVWGLEKFDIYLQNKYGQYMVIPNHSNQRQHNFHYLDLEKPYREYHE